MINLFYNFKTAPFQKDIRGEGCWKKSDLFISIQKSITHFVTNNKKIPVIIFDEAQSMPSTKILSAYRG